MLLKALYILCMAVCIHLVLMLRLPPHNATGERGLNETTIKNGTEYETNNTDSTANGNATSRFDCYDDTHNNFSLECTPDLHIPSLQEQLADRGSLDRGLAILEEYAAGLFNSVVSARRASYRNIYRYGLRYVSKYNFIHGLRDGEVPDLI